MEPVLEALAPELREGVGLTDTVLLPLTVEVGVCAAVPVPLLLEVPEGVEVALGVAVRLPLLLSLPVEEELAPTVTEPVGETETVLLPLTVLEGVLAPVSVLV